MLLDDAIRTRRSIRDFKSDAIPPDAIRKIIDAARLTPSGKNRQPWFFSVLEGEEKDALAKDLRDTARSLENKWAMTTAEIITDAPVLVAVYIESKDNVSDILSVGAAIYGMCLEATALGIGSLWIGDTDILGSCEKYTRLIGAVALGYPAEYPAARPRKSIEEISNVTCIEDAESAVDGFDSVNVTDKPFVFISYSHRDKDAVIADIVELKRHGIPLWYDRELEKGKEWDKQALGFVRHPSCRVFLMYCSYNSLSSEAVLEEFSAALKRLRSDRDFYILPVLIGENSTTDLLTRLEDGGFGEYARVYSEYFTYGNKILYVKRSPIPAVQSHLEDILAFAKDKGVTDDPSIYDSFRYTVRGGACVITGYNGENPHITVPEKISGYPVCEIGESAFAENKVIRSVTLPSTLRQMSLGAFRATHLERISIPVGVTEIHTACFRDCEELREIDLPPRITYIAEALFRGCKSLTEITVPEGVVELKEAAFRSCESLRVARMPSTLKKMTEGGFYGCTALEELIIPEDVEGVEEQSFNLSKKLKRTKIGKFIFECGTVTKEE